MPYDKQTWVNGAGGGTPISAERLSHMEDGLSETSRRQFYAPRDSMRGAAHPEGAVFTSGIASDLSFNEVYQIGAVLPDPWPIDVWGDDVLASDWGCRTSQPIVSSVATYRMMIDGSEFVWFGLGGYEVDLYIDGQPYAGNPLLTAVSGGFGAFGLQKLVFPSARPRLIELRSVAGFVSVYAKKPYRVYLPPADINPKVAVVGDSYVYPSTLSNTIAADRTPDPYLTGLWQRMAPVLGISSMAYDGIGGTGYLNGAPYNYRAASRLAWLDRLQPDVIVVHGGGANDLYFGASVLAIVNEATAYFNQLRTNHPDAKLVFMEGIAPPFFTPATYNPNYVAIRQGVQANLLADGIDAYFVDVATSRPPLDGLGFVTAPSGVGNSDIYIGYDGAHYTEKGATYLRSVIAPKIRRILADRGDLVGSLI